MKRIILAIVFAASLVLTLSATSTARAQYGYYGNYGGHPPCNHVHVRSLVPYGVGYQPLPPAYGYGYGYNYGPAPYGYGVAPYGYAPYGYRGGINVRW